MTKLPTAAGLLAVVDHGEAQQAFSDLLNMLRERLGDDGAVRAGQNAVIDGMFDLWQAYSGAPFALAGTEDYTADMWICDSGDGSSAGTVDRGDFAPGQTDVPGNPRHFLTLDVTTSSGKPLVAHRIESAHTFSGQDCAVGLWARAGAAFDLDVTLRQHFGTGGAPSADNTLAAKTIALGTVWQQIGETFAVPSIGGKVIGTDGNDFLELRLEPPSAGAPKLDVAVVQMEPGQVNTPFDVRSVAEVYQQSLRYYERMQMHAVSIDFPMEGSANSITGAQFAWVFAAPKRAIPTIVGGADDGGTPVTRWNLNAYGGAADGLATNPAGNDANIHGTKISVTRTTGSHSLGDNMRLSTKTNGAAFLEADARL